MLTLADIAKAYGPHTLFEDVTLFLQRQERSGTITSFNYDSISYVSDILVSSEPSRRFFEKSDMPII